MSLVVFLQITWFMWSSPSNRWILSHFSLDKKIVSFAPLVQCPFTVWWFASSQGVNNNDKIHNTHTKRMAVTQTSCCKRHDQIFFFVFLYIAECTQTKIKKNHWISFHHVNREITQKTTPIQNSTHVSWYF